MVEVFSKKQKAQSLKVSGGMTNNTVLFDKPGLTEANSKGFTLKVNAQEKVGMFGPTEASTQEIGKEDLLVGMVELIGWMGVGMTGNG